MSSDLKMRILGWKDRHNANGEITTSRLLVAYDNHYFKVVGRQSDDSHALININVTLLKELQNDDDAKKYIETQLKGRHNCLLVDHHRSTAQNIYLYRIQLDVESAILWAHSLDDPKMEIKIESELYNPVQLSAEYGQSMPHDKITEYGDHDDIDTNSSLNFSNCSGDTRADTSADCEREIVELLGLASPYEQIKDENYQIFDKMCDCFYENAKQIYSDCVAFRKALRKCPDQREELTQKRLKYWLHGSFHKQLLVLMLLE